MYIRTDKIYHHLDRLLAYKEKNIVSPVTIEIHLTNKCNINCYYCSFKDKHNNQEMSLDDAVRCVDKLRLMRVKGITLSGGGEPTTHKYYREIIRYIKMNGLDVALITNGVELDTSILNYLTWIRFSVDASNSAMYKKIKGVNKFNKVVNNIRSAVAYKRLKALDCTIGFQSVIGEDNYHCIEDMVALAQTLGVDYFQYRPIERGAVQEKPFLPGPYNIPIIDTWYKWEEIKAANPYTYCPGADFIGAVGADCNYYICCHHVGDSTASYGNLILDDKILEYRKHVQRNFDYSKCPIACRGAVINRRLTEYNKIEHVNFL